jgi:hypothetical protein
MSVGSADAAHAPDKPKKNGFNFERCYAKQIAKAKGPGYAAGACTDRLNAIRRGEKVTPGVPLR